MSDNPTQFQFNCWRLLLKQDDDDYGGARYNTFECYAGSVHAGDLKIKGAKDSPVCTYIGGLFTVYIDSADQNALEAMLESIANCNNPSSCPAFTEGSTQNLYLSVVYGNASEPNRITSGMLAGSQGQISLGC